jgi:hypothetical protein
MVMRRRRGVQILGPGSVPRADEHMLARFDFVLDLG